jgi:hypothetical protein
MAAFFQSLKARKAEGRGQRTKDRGQLIIV